MLCLFVEVMLCCSYDIRVFQWCCVNHSSCFTTVSFHFTHRILQQTKHIPIITLYTASAHNANSPPSRFSRFG